jgi:hypothetical protein
MFGIYIKAGSIPDNVAHERRTTRVSGLVDDLLDS